MRVPLRGLVGVSLQVLDDGGRSQGLQLRGRARATGIEARSLVGQAHRASLWGGSAFFAVRHRSARGPRREWTLLGRSADRVDPTRASYGNPQCKGQGLTSFDPPSRDTSRLPLLPRLGYDRRADKT